MNLEVRHLKLVKAIVEEGSIANAINKLHLTSSALSHQLREAESQIGAKIFNRINKKMILTEVGEKILKSANLILDELVIIEKEVKQRIMGEVGKVRIYMDCYSIFHWLPKIIKKFDENFPNIKIEVSFNSLLQPMNSLLNGEIDLVITSDIIDNHHILNVELFESEMVALVSSDHYWHCKKYIIAEDFENENIIIHSGKLEDLTVYQEVLKPAMIKPAEITIIPHTETSVEMVKANIGIMVIPEWIATPYLNDNLMIKRITPKGLFITEFAAILDDENRPKYYDYFIEFLKDELEL